MDNNLEYARKAGDIHKKIRENIIDSVQPGINVLDLVNRIESQIKTYTNFDPNNPSNMGIAFPTGISINNCAAHWTPNPGDNYKIKYDDVCKIDYGVHINGIIIDSAFTLSFNPIYDKLLQASKESTELAIKMSGPDTILGEIGTAVQENIESYEIELNNKTHHIKSVKTLTGHQINPYQIHGKKSVPNFSINYPERMKPDEFYAIETFASSGTGIRHEVNNCSHYMINYSDDYLSVSKTKEEIKFFDEIIFNFNTLAFCNRWLNDLKIKNYSKKLKSLISLDVIKKYPPLYDVKGSFISQFEHTIFINDNGKEILS